MAINIFQPLKVGSEVFHPVSYDENTFVMNWTMEAGGKVPTHVHIHMDEHFTVTQGEVMFKVNGKAITKKAGEELVVAKGIPHGISNNTTGQIGLQVKYTPCADAHRMFEILAVLNETSPGSGLNMAKYFYIFPRLGLREFSAIPSPPAMKVMHFIITITGKLSGWDKLVERCRVQV